MTFRVYGLCLRSDPEVRYIGQTCHTPYKRMVSLRGEHSGAHPLGAWLRAHRDDVEAFEIAVFDDREEAKALERSLIRLCTANGNRMFNGDHVPRHLRIAA